MTLHLQVLTRVSKLFISFQLTLGVTFRKSRDTLPRQDFSSATLTVLFDGILGLVPASRQNRFVQSLRRMSTLDLDEVMVSGCILRALKMKKDIDLNAYLVLEGFSKKVIT